MSNEPPNDLAAALAHRLRDAREALVQRWLERITARVSLGADQVFPSEELLDHVPLLIGGIADYLERPDRDIDGEGPVMAKAMELGALRHAQGFDAYQILKEHEILSAILLSFLGTVVDEIQILGTPRELIASWQRVQHAVELIRQATLTHFLRLSAEQVRDREQQLRRFNRMVSHELKNRVGAIRGAVSLLREPWVDGAERERFHAMISENAEGLQLVLENLEALSRLGADARQQRNILLPQAAAEAVRQLRGVVQARDVEVRLSEELPLVEVDAAAVELCLVNYLSNAIKYSDPAKTERWVAIDAELRYGIEPDGAGELIVRVRDNGIGVPPYARDRLFEQFYRAHGDTVSGAEGTGLGLSIVRETVESLGGRAWAEFPDGGTVFAFALPSRRIEDAAAAGTRRPETGAL